MLGIGTLTRFSATSLIRLYRTITESRQILSILLVSGLVDLSMVSASLLVLPRSNA